MKIKNISAFLVILLLTFWNLNFAQEKEILKILNRKLKQEVKSQFQSSNFNEDTISIIEEFSIRKDKILTFTIKKTSPYLNGYQIIKQEVPLHQIKKIGKDIQIILETEKNAVETHFTTVDEGSKVQVIHESLFFLYITDEKEDESLGIKLQEAFRKAGYEIQKDPCYD